MKDELYKTQPPRRNARTFAVILGASMSDPGYQAPLWEYDAREARNAPEGVMPKVARYGGWRAHTIVWLIKKLLPMPEKLYDRRMTP